MINSPLLQTPYLRNQRQFPKDNLDQLATQVDQAYIDIAGKVNSRTIGTFATNFQIVTGEKWYLHGEPKKQQTLRQVYPITSFLSINHGINFNTLTTFTVIRGIGFDGTNYYPIPFIGTAANQDVGIVITPTQITFKTGGSPPTITSGFVLLEWLSQF